MAKTTSDLIMIAGTGANIVIDASTKTTSDIIMLVGAIGRKGSHITLKNCNQKTTSDLLMICRVYPNNITLDFTDNTIK
jgi:Ni2+-binding GTPase involved in maturation of urease and hydrogenase